MLLEEANGVIDAYSKWVGGNMRAVQQGDSVLIITPMINRDNDCMSVLIGESPDGGYALTDLGETVSGLEMSGFSLSSGKRPEKVERILRRYGVNKTDENEIFVRASRDEIPAKLNMMLQAMASVDDLYQLSKDSVRELFCEDVGKWMSDNEIRSVAGPSFAGRSGLMYQFDYAIPSSKNSPERLVKTVNYPSESTVKNVLFGWYDVEAMRKDSVGYAFLNSRSLNGKDISTSAIEACNNLGIKVVRWGIDEKEFIPELAA